MIKKVGITGGIGSGKSIVSKIIEAMGYPVFNSDEEAKKIVNHHPSVKTDLISLFGEDIYTGDQIDKSRLSTFIFNNPSLREKVNEIIHPRVREAFDTFAKNSNIVFNEAAILF